MNGAGFVERYRSYAAKCVKISRHIPEPAGKLVLLEMAQSWLNLAEKAAEAAESPPASQAAVSGRREEADQGNPATSET
jgi:hypothetical protein